MDGQNFYQTIFLKEPNSVHDKKDLLERWKDLLERWKDLLER
jgi:hypothetical protein